MNMRHRTRVARELLRIARELVEGATFLRDDFNKYKDELKGHGIDTGAGFDDLFDVFDSRKEMEEFLSVKAETFPNLMEIIGKDAFISMLEHGYFMVVSGGLSSKDSAIVSDWIKEYSGKRSIGKITDEEYEEILELIESVKKDTIHLRDEKLKRFLSSLPVRCYETLGIYEQKPERSYVVDLTNQGKNSESQRDDLFNRILQFCGKDIQQTAVIARKYEVESYISCNGGDLDKTLHEKYEERFYGFDEDQNAGGQSEARHSQYLTDNPERDFTRWHNKYDFRNKIPGTGLE